MKKAIFLNLIFVILLGVVALSPVNAQVTGIGIDSIIISDNSFLNDGQIDIPGLLAIVFTLLLGSLFAFIVARAILLSFKWSKAGGEKDKREEVIKGFLDLGGATLAGVLAFPVFNTIINIVGIEADVSLDAPCIGNYQGGSASGFYRGQDFIDENNVQGDPDEAGTGRLKCVANLGTASEPNYVYLSVQSAQNN